MTKNASKPGDAGEGHPFDAVLNRLEPAMQRGGPAPGFATLRATYSDTPLLDRMLAAEARFTPGLDRKGQAAYLMITHAIGATKLAAACLIGAGVVPRMGPEELALRVVVPGPEDRRNDTVLRLLSQGFVTDLPDLAAHPDAELAEDRDALCDRMREILEAHFALVVDRLNAATGLSRAALWRLAGDSIAGNFLDAGRRLGREAEAKAAALRILKHPGSPLTNREMHYFDVSIPDPKRPEQTLLTWAFRARGGCCRWYTATEGQLCTTCVLRSEADRRAMAEGGVRRRLGLPPRAEPALP